MVQPARTRSRLHRGHAGLQAGERRSMARGVPGRGQNRLRVSAPAGIGNGGRRQRPPCAAFGSVGARRRDHPGRRRRVHQRGRLPYRLAVFRLGLRPLEHGRLQDGAWHHFKMDLGDPDHRAAFLEGEVPDDLTAARSSGHRNSPNRCLCV